MNLKIPNDMGKSDSDSSIEDEAGYGDDNYVIDHDAIDLSAHSEDVEDVMNEMTPSSKVGERRRKKKWMKNTTHGITKVAKGVKTGTIKSGTFIGKAVTYPIKGHGRKQKRKYLKEKHSKKTRGKSKSKDHHIAVNKAIRNMRTPSGASNSIMAGQLQAPDQSCRTVSNILSRLSSSPSIEAAKLLEFHLSSTTDLDASFLSGGTAEVRFSLCLLIPIFFFSHDGPLLRIARSRLGTCQLLRSSGRVHCCKGFVGKPLARRGLHCLQVIH